MLSTDIMNILACALRHQDTPAGGHQGKSAPRPAHHSQPGLGRRAWEQALGGGAYGSWHGGPGVQHSSGPRVTLSPGERGKKEHKNQLA